MRVAPFLFLAAFSHADPIADNQARLGKLEGTVYLLSQGAKNWIDAHEDLPLLPGDVIHTEEDSKAEVVLSQHVLILVQPESDLMLDTVEANKGKAHVTSGQILARVDAAAPIRQGWEFETPGAVATVRGAAFGMETREMEGTRLSVYEQDLELQPAEGPAGLPPALKIGTKKEVALRRGAPVQVLSKLSEGMKTLGNGVPDLKIRQLRVENTWSPLTTTYRVELRKKFVAAVRVTPPRPTKRRVRRGASADAAF